MTDRLAEFDYEHDLALIWHIAGRKSPVRIDPRFHSGLLWFTVFPHGYSRDAGPLANR